MNKIFTKHVPNLLLPFLTVAIIYLRLRLILHIHQNIETPLQNTMKANQPNYPRVDRVVIPVRPWV